MKVLEKGQKPVWSKEVMCTGYGNGGGGCGAKLLVDNTDLYHTYNSDMYGDVYATHITFRCPECDVQTDIKVRLPRWIKLPNWKPANANGGE